MKTIFKKAHLPLIKSAVHSKEGESQYALYYKMRTEDGLDRQYATELLLLERGAYAGDTRAMVELARAYYFHGGKYGLPQALSWWHRAIKVGSRYALNDISEYKIFERIMSYNDMEWGFANIEMQCAMLAEWYLTDLGRTDWKSLSVQERRERCKRLADTVCEILEVPRIKLEVVPNLTYKNKQGEDALADGLADSNWNLRLRQEMMDDYERLIEVIFHEIGHIVCFALQAEKRKGESDKLKKKYGVSDERIDSWDQQIMGYEVVTSEEDPDTLSYGTYTNWAILFA